MKKKKTLKTLIFISISIILFITFVFIVFKPVDKKTIIQGENGIWLTHRWVDNIPNKIEITNLSINLRNANIKHLFLHIGPLDSFGNISTSKYLFADSFIFQIKRIYPEIISIQAWIGQIEKKGNGILDIEDSIIRNNIVSTTIILQKYGFDGVHIDIEPILDNDIFFLNLLDEINKFKKPDFLLTIATPKIIPSNLFGFEKKFLSISGLWSPNYYKIVSQKADFLVIMLYDTAIKNKILYNLFISKEVSLLTRILNKKIMFGIPSYDEKKNNFNSEIENIMSALNSINLGLKYGKNDNYKGFSIYADWTTDSSEWNLLEKYFKEN